MRKIIQIAGFILFLMIVFTLIGVAPAKGAPNISGKSAVLIDAKSGQVLYELKKEEKLSPASTTKILTAIIAIESGKLDETVTIGANPPRLEGTSVYLEEGEKVKLRTLVQAALVYSANDAALAIAEYLADTGEEFAKIMNEKAALIGAVNSNFVNPHGLTEEGHYSTAYDLALLGKYAMENEVFQEIVSLKVLDWEGQAWQTRLINKNEILWSYNGANGVKTGYTKDAKNTIVASATRDGRTYIAAVLGSPSSGIWEDAQNLLDLGFSGFQQIELAQPGEVKAQLSIDGKELQLVPEQAFVISLPNGTDKNKLQTKLVLEQIEDKIIKGEKAGRIIYYLDDKEVGQLELVFANTLTPAFDFMRIMLYILAGLFFLQVCWRIYQGMRRKQQRRDYGYGCYKGY
ncbi:MAG: D-alanyl-D-alanine carboxypeptidase [Firmicutes bacterium HGW-Firmicutes-12]|jgi:D-alanyl-D-alanine carboxypeptidase (penicillin-binding protein 5/6)|nr:MAG: D-alanyl-D-alanine carboxypeptidase [Firmicutes bacterium HGW-Firmicutes-12]